MTSWSTNESRNIFRFMQQNHHQPFFQGIWRHPHVLSHGLHGDQLVLNIFRRTTPLPSGRIHEDHLLSETCRLEHALREMFLSTRRTLMWGKNSTLHCVWGERTKISVCVQSPFTPFTCVNPANGWFFARSSIRSPTRGSLDQPNIQGEMGQLWVSKRMDGRAEFPTQFQTFLGAHLLSGCGHN